MISEQAAERARAVSPKVTAALVDALAPLVTRGGIVAINATALVAIDDNEAIPVVVTLGLTPEAVSALMQALQGFARGMPLLDQTEFAVPKPVKQ